MDSLNAILLILVIIVGFIFIKKYFHVMNVESFDSFSPYMGNQSYPFVYQKNLDQERLQKTLAKWEKPFNCYNEGYYNAGFYPPFVQISSYVEMKDKLFGMPPPGSSDNNYIV